MKKLPRRVASIGLFLVLVLPFLVILYLLLSEIEIGIRFAQRERIGLEYIRAVRMLVQQLQQHRTAAASEAPDAAAIGVATSKVDEAVARLDAIDPGLGRELRASELWMALRTHWRELQRNSIAGVQSTAEHDAVIAESIALALHVGDMSNLILDPDLDSYYFMDAVVTKLLPIAERLEQVRSLGLRAAARETLDPDERTRLITRLSAIREAMADVDRGIAVAYQKNPSLPATLPTQPADMAALRHSLDVTQRTLVEETAADFAHPEFAAANQRAVVGTYQLFDEISPSLDRLLEQRIAGFNRKKYWVEAFALLALATAVCAFWAYARGQEARRRTEQELVSSELRKGAILESALDCIITMDLDGRVTEFNPAAERTFGYRRADVVGKELGSLIVPPALREMHRRGLAQYRETGEGAVLGKRIEINAMHADGHEFMVELAITPIQIGGTTMFTAYLRDITERLRAAEDLRKAKEAAEAANLAKSGFLANMSHEIRTPMNGILGMTELALNTQLTPSQREYLAMVKNSAESLLALLNDLLDFSKIEAGKLELENVAFDLRDTLGDTMQTLATRASEKGLELALHVRPDVPDALVGDPFRLRQIVVNLVGNALKFTERGEITVRVESDGASETTALLRFAVADTGIGIPPEARARIFSAFEQGDASTTRRYGGTGLGLAIASRIVDLMGGEIKVESEVGRGSTFSLQRAFWDPDRAERREPFARARRRARARGG